ncbi:MAG: hypothetical protein OEW00_00295 [candidate division Zixibacteria bacterium]|nr:hypothetical protein [candidate division Zixibacteria bacterium]
MKKNITILLAAFLLAAWGAKAEPGVECELAVYQFDTSRNDDVLLMADTVELLKGVLTTGFLTSFSIDIEIKDLDSARTSFDVHIVTLGASANTYARSFTAEYGLPARLDGIRGKNEVLYSLIVTPVREAAIDLTECSFDRHMKGTFDFLPTANTDIYFVPKSLGDFYWESVKELMETQYRNFQAMFNFNLPGKYSIFLCPCPLKSVIWDKRFGMASDPTRNVGYAIYNNLMNSADPFLVILTAVMRNWGYAPPFLSEGLANYLSVAVFDTKGIFRQSPDLSLSGLLNTYQYFHTDPYIADRTSASFVRFLIDTYNLEEFSKLYQEADDLNLSTKLEEVYGKSLEELEAEWRHYVDTATINYRDLAYQAYLSEMMFNYRAMLKYCRAAAEYAVNTADSLRTLSALKRAYFFNGDYYAATSVQLALTALMDTSASEWMAQGSYRMMNGYYREALADYTKALEMDPENPMVKFNLASYYFYQNDDKTAAQYLTEIVEASDNKSAEGESRVLLGHILKRSPEEADRLRATTYLNQARQVFEQVLAVDNASPSSQMWAGIASAGLAEYDDALNYLQAALFLESRPFYLGMINLWLGKVYDLTGDRQNARAHYGQVLALPSADYHQKEAHKYLDEAYSN